MAVLRGEGIASTLLLTGWRGGALQSGGVACSPIPEVISRIVVPLGIYIFLVCLYCYMKFVYTFQLQSNGTIGRNTTVGTDRIKTGVYAGR